jgi:hypothetical protein
MNDYISVQNFNYWIVYIYRDGGSSCNITQQHGHLYGIHPTIFFLHACLESNRIESGEVGLVWFGLHGSDDDDAQYLPIDRCLTLHPWGPTSTSLLPTRGTTRTELICMQAHTQSEWVSERPSLHCPHTALHARASITSSAQLVSWLQHPNCIASRPFPCCS